MEKSRIPVIIIFIFAVINIFTIQSCKKDPPKPDRDTCTVDYKPNIYFFPEENIQIDVKLNFPLGGEVIKSEPLYNDGWSVQIDTTGLIDNLYDFLFYESKQPDVWQYEKGWHVKKENLQVFFESNLAEYGFGNKEITDFIEYWIPIFTESNYYMIYPQDKDIIDQAIELLVSIKPDNILRLHYVIKETKEPEVEITAPVIEEFNNEGFYITEWGVIL
ncbi:MAG: hypothetical protein K8R54_14380 [Bacteroidales bacterium]|nr:hypothetical protein [Bacteroidales bacterium]